MGFRYGGHLAGDALKSKVTAPILSEGRAFGAALSAYHGPADLLPGTAIAGARAALSGSLGADAERQREFGVYDQADHDARRERLLAILAHYIDTADQFSSTPAAPSASSSSRSRRAPATSRRRGISC